MTITKTVQWTWFRWESNTRMPNGKTSKSREDVRAVLYADIGLVSYIICASNLPTDANKSPVIATDGNPITDAHLSANFKKFRDSATNVVVNADSYSLLGAICDSEMERLRKRAIMRGDVVCSPSSFCPEVHFNDSLYLPQRGGASCKHPPDYFAKKVAAAKASKEKAAGLTPTGQKGKATGLTPAGQKMVKGAKTLGTGKGTSKVVGKAGKSALTKTPKPSLGKSPLKGSKSALSTGRTSKTGTRGTLSKAKTPGLSKSSRMKAPNGKLSKTLSKTSTRAKGSKVLSKSAGIKGSKTGTRESKAMSKSTSMKGSKARSKSAGMKASKTSTRGSKATSKSAGMKGSKAGSNSTRHQVTVESGSQGDLQGRRPSRHLEVDGRQIAFQNSSRQDLESGLFRSLGFQERRHAEKWCSRRETDEGYIHSCLYSSSRKADFQVIIEGHGSQVVQGTNLQSDLSRAESRRVGF